MNRCEKFELAENEQTGYPVVRIYGKHAASLVIFASLLHGGGVALAAESGTQCDVNEISVSTTPVPEQGPAKLKDAMEGLGRIPASADVVLLGDSLARQITPDIAEVIFPGQTVWNYGVGGDTTQNVLWRMRDDSLKAIHPSMVLVFVGTNNLSTHEQSGCGIAAGMKAVVARAKELWPSANVVLLPLFPRGPDFHFEDPNRIEANRLSGAIDVDDARITCGGYANPVRSNINYACSPEEMLKCENYQKDNIHLTMKGYTSIASYLAR